MSSVHTTHTASEAAVHRKMGWAGLDELDGKWHTDGTEMCAQHMTFAAGQVSRLH